LLLVTHMAFDPYLTKIEDVSFHTQDLGHWDGPLRRYWFAVNSPDFVETLRAWCNYDLRDGISAGSLADTLEELARALREGPDDA